MRPDLAARYADDRLPRYTSYPTAPLFSPAIDPRTYAGWLSAVPADAVGSLYVHIPFCRRMCWYCGCNTSVAPRLEPVSDYLDALDVEIGMVSESLPRRLGVSHVHFGGGTPTIVSPAKFRRLAARLREAFDILPGAEVAIEIDPRMLSAEMAEALGDAGITRASLGVQSLDPDVQAAINRIQSLGQTALALRRLREAGIGGINIDLIYGLPRQTLASAVATTEACIALGADRLSVFGYAHVPGFKRHQRKIDPSTLPNGTERAAQAAAIAATLESAGYVRIGLDHFARPDDAMARAAASGTLHRNFQGYTTDAADLLIGLGASAIGRLPAGYLQNAPVTRDYVDAMRAGRLATVRGYALDDADRLRAELIERLMCDFAVDIDAVCRRHGRTPSAVADALPLLDRLAADGLLVRDGTRVMMKADARDLVRVAAAAFDAYRAGSAALHSRAV